MSIMLADKGKAIFFGLTLVCCTTLVGIGKMSSDVIQGVIFTLLGYTAGNGVNALAKRAPSPMLIPRDQMLPEPKPQEFP
jgi:hypothetical protein